MFPPFIYDEGAGEVPVAVFFNLDMPEHPSCCCLAQNRTDHHKAISSARVQLLGVSHQALLLYIPAPGWGVPVAAFSIAGQFQAEMAIW